MVPAIGPAVPDNLEAAAATKQMRHLGKIMVPRQKQEGPVAVVCKASDLSALQPDVPPVL